MGDGKGGGTKKKYGRKDNRKQVSNRQRTCLLIYWLEHFGEMSVTFNSHLGFRTFNTSPDERFLRRPALASTVLELQGLGFQTHLLASGFSRSLYLRVSAVHQAPRRCHQRHRQRLPLVSPVPPLLMHSIEAERHVVSSSPWSRPSPPHTKGGQ